MNLIHLMVQQTLIFPAELSAVIYRLLPIA